MSPSVSSNPSLSPSVSKEPSLSPSVSQEPSLSPSVSQEPSLSPSVSQEPTAETTSTPAPTEVPSLAPTATPLPSAAPTASPSEMPSPQPTPRPTHPPTHPPTFASVSFSQDESEGPLHFRENFRETRYTPYPIPRPAHAPTPSPHPRVAPLTVHYLNVGKPTTAPTRDPDNASNSGSANIPFVPLSPFHEFHSTLISMSTTGMPTTTTSPSNGPTIESSNALYFPFREYHSTLISNPTRAPPTPPTPAITSLQGTNNTPQSASTSEAPLDSPFRLFYLNLAAKGVHSNAAIDATLAMNTPGPSPIDAPSAIPFEEVSQSQTSRVDDYNVPDEYQLTLSVDVHDIPELSDPSLSSAVETTLVQYLADEVTEVEGVPLFFLKANVQLDSSKDSTNGIIGMKIKATVLATGEQIDMDVLQDSIQNTLQQDKEELENHLRGAIHSWSSTQPRKTNHESLVDTPREGKRSTVIMVATCVTTIIIITAALSVCIVMGAKKGKREDPLSVGAVMEAKQGMGKELAAATYETSLVSSP